MTRRTDQDEHLQGLLPSLARLKLRAERAGGGAEADLVALIDEIERIRRELVRGRERVIAELGRATQRTTAITAYARGANAAGRSGRH
ncbi:hypothetical protein [Rhodopseudomonas telluris]|uniref:Uncharacterized protein n=1 Tax=Rhodopseudomonas telluris TaxID=644215 RepID=A0ABV6EQD9_9BRAD